ncbi:hypothetical protein MHYP_G00213940 [Metynnis hypsauchen]
MLFKEKQTINSDNETLALVSIVGGGCLAAVQALMFFTFNVGDGELSSNAVVAGLVCTGGKIQKSTILLPDYSYWRISTDVTGQNNVTFFFGPQLLTSIQKNWEAALPETLIFTQAIFHLNLHMTTSWMEAFLVALAFSWQEKRAPLSSVVTGCTHRVLFTAVHVFLTISTVDAADAGEQE